MVEVTLTDRSVPEKKRTEANSRWTLDITDGQATLRDPTGQMRNAFTPRDADEQFALPSFSKSSPLQIPADEGVLSCDASKEGLKHIRAFMRRGAQAAGPEALRTRRNKAVLILAGGAVVTSIGILLAILRVTQRGGPDGRIGIGTIVFGGVLLGRGIYALIECARVARLGNAAETPIARSTLSGQAASQAPTAHSSVEPMISVAAARPRRFKPIKICVIIMLAFFGLFGVMKAAGPVGRALESAYQAYIDSRVEEWNPDESFSEEEMLLALNAGNPTPDPASVSLREDEELGRESVSSDPPVSLGAALEEQSELDPDRNTDPEQLDELDTDSHTPSDQKEQTDPDISEDLREYLSIPEDIREFLNIPEPGLTAKPADLVVTGAIRIVSENFPASLRVGQFQSATKISLFIEKGNITPDVPIQLDYTSRGVVNINKGRRPPDKPGYMMRSYLLHADTPGNRRVILKGSVTFPNVIIGIIAKNDTLDASDKVFKIPEIRYATGGKWRKWWDGGGGEVVTISDDRKTLTVTTTTGQYIDEMRVITGSR